MTGCSLKMRQRHMLKQMNSLFNKVGLYCGNKPYNLLAPLANLDRIEIINLALKLKVPLALTWSCHRKAKSIATVLCWYEQNKSI